MNLQSSLRRGTNQSLHAALAEAEERYVAANPGSARLQEAASVSLPGGNTRTTVFFSPFPLFMTGGKGSRLTDVDGHEYVDFVNEYTAGLFGHSHPVVAEAISEAIASGINLGAPSEGEVKLSAAIRQRFPAMELLRFCNSGTEANLLAMAAARVASGKDAVMVFGGAYHGSLFTFSHGASPLNMPIPAIMSRYNDAAKVVADIEASSERLAAVLVEPMQGSAGALPASVEFLRAVREACSRRAAILIFDEVMTSRVHNGGLQGKHGIRPDMVTLGKYLGGGITFGAFGGRRSIMEGFDPSRPDPLQHGGTFNNNVIAMTAGCRVMERLLSEEALATMNRCGDELREALNRLADTYRLPVQTTGTGSIFGIHFHRGALRNVEDLRDGERGREAEIAALKKLFHFDMLSAGIYLSRRLTGNLSLMTTKAECSQFLAGVEEFFVNRGDLVGAAFEEISS
ncbi:MAG: aspartate aminotransferase family protein [Aestuariivirgaceae bacterium]